MNICDINNSVKAHKKAKRVGRGESSGYGKTSGRGHKGLGQKSCTSMLRSEGGQMQLFRRLPKRGFNNANFRKEYAPINLGAIDPLFAEGELVSLSTLQEKGFHKSKSLLKVLGNGDITKALTFKVHGMSKSARVKIEKAGGKIEIIEAGSTKEK